MNKEILAQDTRCWTGAPLPAQTLAQPQVTLMRITLDPGQRLAMHTHPVINAGYVLSGTLTVVTASGISRTFNAGEAIIEMVDAPHYGMNPGDEPTVLIMTYISEPGIPLSM